MSCMIAEVVAAAQSGDEGAFETLYNEGKNNVYYLGLKMLKNRDDAEDLVQEVFVTVCQKIGELQNPDAFFGWLKQIAANRCKNKLVKKDAVLFSADDGAADVPEEAEFSEEFLPEKAAENRHLADSVMRLIHALPEEQRMVVLLFYYQQMKTREIAEALGISENTVKSRLSYARKTLKAGAEEEERKGNKLYSFSPALLFILLKEDAAASAASLSLGWSGIAHVAKGSAAAVSSAGAGSQSAATAAARAIAATVVKKAGLGLVAKILVGAAAAVALAAGSFVAASLITQSAVQPADESYTAEAATEADASLSSPTAPPLSSSTAPSEPWGRIPGDLENLNLRGHATPEMMSVECAVYYGMESMPEATGETVTIRYPAVFDVDARQRDKDKVIGEIFYLGQVDDTNFGLLPRFHLTAREPENYNRGFDGAPIPPLIRLRGYQRDAEDGSLEIKDLVIVDKPGEARGFLIKLYYPGSSTYELFGEVQIGDGRIIQTYLVDFKDLATQEELEALCGWFASLGLE